MSLRALDWKRFYAEERRALGDAGLAALVRSAPEIAVPERGALLFPHTRLAASGRWVAAVARAVVRAQPRRVLALGVLHGARAADAELLRRARRGDALSRDALRRVHGPGAPHDGGHASEEFSLDGFRALVAVAARVEGLPEPELVERHPFLVGDAPETVTGVEELRELVAEGAALVASADLVHHGVGYGTPPDLALPRTEATRSLARDWVGEQLAALGSGDFERFSVIAGRQRSDFRDAGPMLSHILARPVSFRVQALELVDYADVLAAAEPTWVAATLATASSGEATDCAPPLRRSS